MVTSRVKTGPMSKGHSSYQCSSLKKPLIWPENTAESGGLGQVAILKQKKRQNQGDQGEQEGIGP